MEVSPLSQTPTPASPLSHRYSPKAPGHLHGCTSPTLCLPGAAEAHHPHCQRCGLESFSGFRRGKVFVHGIHELEVDPWGSESVRQRVIEHIGSLQSFMEGGEGLIGGPSGWRRWREKCGTGLRIGYHVGWIRRRSV
ncbi:gliding motility lipoprotein GldJ [Sesbania bispinosa]|nr:gliding motility lipoprotein GldJ [Sesbania bispinosa]